MKCRECGEQIGKSGICESCQTQEILVPGTMLENRYNIISVVGRGGMGFVYKALDSRLHNTVVAVKEMRSTLKKGKALDRSIKSFESEAAMLSQLRHPALPRILDFFSSESRWYLVMDFIDGQNLDEYIKGEGPVSETQARVWARELCDVLDYLHSRNPPVIFRDLKPSNVMLDMSGQLKVVDFGIARHFKVDIASDTTYYYSSGFSPPEQYGASQTDSRSDIYSLGATLHYLVSGIHPQKTPFVFKPLDAVADVSSQFNDVVMAAVSIDPSDRPSSAREMQEMLEGDYVEEHVSSDMTHPLAGGHTARVRVTEKKFKELPISRAFTFVKDKAITTSIVAGVLAILVLGGLLVSNYLSGDNASSVPDNDMIDVPAVVQGSGNDTSGVFRLEDPDFLYRYGFHVALDNFPEDNERISWEIKLFRVGENTPIRVFDEFVLGRELREWGWTPSKVRDFGDKQVAGVASGFSGNLLPELGDYYFEVKVSDNIDRWYIVVQTELNQERQAEDMDDPEVWDDISSVTLEDLFQGVVSTGSAETPVFTLPDDGITYLFTFNIMLDELPDADEQITCDAALYRVGEDAPVWESDWIILREHLEERGWTPSYVEIYEGHTVLRGIVGGAGGTPFPGPGSYYLVIDVSGVNRWFFNIRELN